MRKQLDKTLRTASSTNARATTGKLAARTLPLSARVAALQSAEGSGIGLEDAGEVVVAGTGRAIEKVVNVAAFFRGQGDCVVTLRTGSVGAVDEVGGQEGEDDGLGWEEAKETRTRMVSSLEVAIRLR